MRARWPTAESTLPLATVPAWGWRLGGKWSWAASGDSKRMAVPFLFLLKLSETDLERFLSVQKRSKKAALKEI